MSFEDVDPPAPPREAIASCKTCKAAADHNAMVFLSRQRSHDSRMSRALRDGSWRFEGVHGFVTPSGSFRPAASEATLFSRPYRAIRVLFGKRNKMRFLALGPRNACMKANRRWGPKGTTEMRQHTRTETRKSVDTLEASQSLFDSSQKA